MPDLALNLENVGPDSKAVSSVTLGQECIWNRKPASRNAVSQHKALCSLRRSPPHTRAHTPRHTPLQAILLPCRYASTYMVIRKGTHFPSDFCSPDWQPHVQSWARSSPPGGLCGPT